MASETFNASSGFVASGVVLAGLLLEYLQTLHLAKFCSSVRIPGNCLQVVLAAQQEWRDTISSSSACSAGFLCISYSNIRKALLIDANLGKETG
jgi:hypothetical protein